ncbi:unnamed protein product [Staurois parvus]|uniref:Uncharacterized protein n=1 Tax=Staurois parvus TaxID=386267 RepID=A0ABN9GPC7_9NEOB|nr:unnamed protein product [Staurois parvus]
MYVHTHKHTHMYIHTQTHVHTHTCTYTQTHVQIHTCTYTQTPPPSIKSCSTSLFIHRDGYCTLGGGQRAQHTLLPLLSLCSAIEQSDSSQCQ